LVRPRQREIIFAGFHWKAPEAEFYYSASVLAPLGWALAAGIGCKFNRKEPVVVITGDGCMQMHGIELKTAIKYDKPLLVVIMNNNALGSIYKRYKKISNYAAEMASITEIDWELFARSFNAEVFTVDSDESLGHKIQMCFSNKKLTILNVMIPRSPYVHDSTLTKSAFA
jgi:acetolactate synthase-1/2/3 large subunit